MNEVERPALMESIEQCMEMYNDTPKNPNVWWSACHRYPLDVVCKALMAHMQDPTDGKYPPRPADVIRRVSNLQPSDGHLPADEAWAIAAKAMDESETVVMTQEIAEAWGVAREVMCLGDEVGGRMAFRSAYERRVAAARADGLRPTWFASLGQDPQKRAAALESAADRLRLPHLAAQAVIEDQSKQPLSPQAAEWIARARYVMAMQAPRPDSEAPLDEIVTGLPEDGKDRSRALAAMHPSQEHRIRNVLGEAEKKRQLGILNTMIAPEEWEEHNRKKAEGLLPPSSFATAP